MPDLANLGGKMSDCVHLTYRYRVRDKHASKLDAMARAVNFVWNYCNDVQIHAAKWGRKWPSWFDLEKLVAGSSGEFCISQASINRVCRQYAASRTQRRRPRLRFRGKHTLGWVPFRAQDMRPIDGGFKVMGIRLSVFGHRHLPLGAMLSDGCSLAQDARGRWFLNVVLKVKPVAAREPERRLGIDLGLQSFAVLSTGGKIAAPRIFRGYEAALACAQRAGKRALARRIHDQARAARKDFLHKLTTGLVAEFDFIAVGDVSASALAKTKMAKSVLDAGWSSFRKMLAYKSIANGARYAEVDESYSTQACSDCGVIGGPKGRQGLVIREWTCEHCGAVHCRDTNAAKNILRRGLATLLEEPTQRIVA